MCVCACACVCKRASMSRELDYQCFNSTDDVLFLFFKFPTMLGLEKNGFEIS